jgi:predicted metal-dependent HD superfamily phosphohydrolase
MNEHDAETLFPISRRWTETLMRSLDGLILRISGDESKTELTDFLIAKYSEKHRAYHNLSHIKALLAPIFKMEFEDRDEAVELAIWFHDAIYDPKSSTNEVESARLAVEKLSELNYPKAKIERVEKMILATEKHDASGLDEDGKMFLDLDLGILGADVELYKKYSKAIRAEYSFVPEDLYREKRREILERFLQRKSIYYTVEMRESHEKAARANIANEIKELS